MKPKKNIVIILVVTILVPLSLAVAGEKEGGKKGIKEVIKKEVIKEIKEAAKEAIKLFKKEKGREPSSAEKRRITADAELEKALNMLDAQFDKFMKIVEEMDNKSSSEVKKKGYEVTEEMKLLYKRTQRTMKLVAMNIKEVADVYMKRIKNRKSDLEAKLLEEISKAEMDNKHDLAKRHRDRLKRAEKVVAEAEGIWQKMYVIADALEGYSEGDMIDNIKELLLEFETQLLERDLEKFKDVYTKIKKTVNKIEGLLKSKKGEEEGLEERLKRLQ